MEEARKVVDASEMAAMPHCQLEPVGADAGTVHFCQPKSIAIILRNTGEVGAGPSRGLCVRRLPILKCWHGITLGDDLTASSAVS